MNDRRSSAARRWFLAVFVIVLALLAAADAVIDGHPHFGIDGVFAFYGWFGLAACGALVAVAWAWSVLVRRGDDYYDGE